VHVTDAGQEVIVMMVTDVLVMVELPYRVGEVITSGGGVVVL